VARAAHVERLREHGVDVAIARRARDADAAVAPRALGRA
jgi:hypothetical protein